MTTDRWNLRGQYFENCNCEILCPCVLPVPRPQPTEGYCDVGIAFHVEAGELNGVSLAGLNFVVAAHTPGVMGDGNWTTAFFVDERATEEQRQALESILSGDMGGPMARWISLTTDMKDTTYCQITFEMEGETRRVSIPNVMDFAVEGIKAPNRDQVMLLENAGHPVNSTLALARGTGNTYTGHGMTWDNTGRNGHYAPFNWSWP